MDLQTIILAALSSSLLAGIVAGLFARSKMKADTEAVSIQNAIKIEELAVMRYTSIEEKLRMAETSLVEIKTMLNEMQSYIEYLHGVMDEHKIPYKKKDF